MSIDGQRILHQFAAVIRNGPHPFDFMTIIRRFLAPVIAATLCLNAASAQEAKLKIATVDMQELFKQYHRTNEAQKQINIEQARIQKDRNERSAKIRELEASTSALHKQLEDASLSESRKQSLFKEWQMQREEGIHLERDLRETMERRSRALQENMVQRMRGILEEIRKLVEEQAKVEDYDYVFDKSGLSTSQVPFLIYTKDATDITASLLKDLNKDAPAEAASDEIDADETPAIEAPAEEAQPDAAE